MYKKFAVMIRGHPFSGPPFSCRMSDMYDIWLYPRQDLGRKCQISCNRKDRKFHFSPCVEGSETTSLTHTHSYFNTYFSVSQTEAKLYIFRPIEMLIHMYRSSE